MAATASSEEGIPVPSDVSNILASVTDGFEYRMPAEWEKHSACVILFPHSTDTFRVENAAKEIVHLSLTIATVGREAVYLLCTDSGHAASVQQTIRDAISNTKDEPLFPICVGICPSNDTWARDTAPTFVVRTNMKTSERELVGLDWNFNAYGGPHEGCYWPCIKDQQIPNKMCSGLVVVEDATKGDSTPTKMSESLSIHSSLPVPLILEGGSIHTDGEGTLLTTCECLLHPNRNPHLAQDDIEQVLKKSLGVTKILWLPYGLDADDDTNGHVDNFCCFVAPGHVVLAWTDVEDDGDGIGNYQRCRMARDYLETQTDAKGRPITITKLYLPSIPLRYTQDEAFSIGAANRQSDDSSALIRHPNEIMAASYINYYLANGAVLVPQFAGSAAYGNAESRNSIAEADQKALETLQSVFPDRTVVGIPSREILLGGGNIHCQTQQVPSI